MKCLYNKCDNETPGTRYYCPKHETEKLELFSIRKKLERTRANIVALSAGLTALESKKDLALDFEWNDLAFEVVILTELMKDERNRSEGFSSQ
jgi:hypothetical protein